MQKKPSFTSKKGEIVSLVDGARIGGELLAMMDRDDIEALAEDLKMSSSRLTGWRDEFLADSNQQKQSRSENSDLFVMASLMLNLLKKLPKTKEKFGQVAI